MSLTDADLAYMRATQAEHRPTEATLFRHTTTRTATGGRTTGYEATGTTLAVRIDGSPDKVPGEIADRLEGSTAVKITMDQVLDVRAGDQVRVSATEVYTLVSDGDPDRWATAQVVWARRVAFPAR